MAESKYTFQDVETLKIFLKEELLNSAETAETLGITRQALHSLVKRGKMVPVKEASKDRLFLREDVEKRKKESETLKDKIVKMFSVNFEILSSIFDTFYILAIKIHPHL